MKLYQNLKDVLMGKRNVSDVWHYLVGHYRYWLWYTVNKDTSIKPKLMRQHIWEQINYRISQMNPKCYAAGSCERCGCNTTELQMASKTCEGLEYPPMINKNSWDKYKIGKYTVVQGLFTWVNADGFFNKPRVYKELPTGFIEIKTPIDVSNN